MTKLVGGILVAVGILVMTGSGLCSLGVIVMALADQGASVLTMAWLPLAIGGVPFLIGFLLMRGGQHILRQAADTED